MSPNETKVLMQDIPEEQKQEYIPYTAEEIPLKKELTPKQVKARKKSKEAKKARKANYKRAKQLKKERKNKK